MAKVLMVKIGLWRLKRHGKEVGLRVAPLLRAMTVALGGRRQKSRTTGRGKSTLMSNTRGSLVAYASTKMFRSKRTGKMWISMREESKTRKHWGLNRRNHLRSWVA